MLTEQQIQSVITDILRREGANVDDPLDHGGETHFGITIPFAGQWHIPWPPTLAEARQGYRDMLRGTKIDQIGDFATLALVADSAVNHGDGQAIKWLQAAVGHGIAIDGRIGPQTLAQLAIVPDWRKVRALILGARIRFYGRIVANDHSQARFINGWLNRACEFLAG